MGRRRSRSQLLAMERLSHLLPIVRQPGDIVADPSSCGGTGSITTNNIISFNLNNAYHTFTVVGTNSPVGGGGIVYLNGESYQNFDTSAPTEFCGSAWATIQVQPGSYIVDIRTTNAKPLKFQYIVLEGTDPPPTLIPGASTPLGTSPSPSETVSPASSHGASRRTVAVAVSISALVVLLIVGGLFALWRRKRPQSGGRLWNLDLNGSNHLDGSSAGEVGECEQTGTAPRNVSLPPGIPPSVQQSLNTIPTPRPSSQTEERTGLLRGQTSPPLRISSEQVHTSSLQRPGPGGHVQ
ncbi:hypothetical protein FRB99_001488, partial [Tulasnella sp. 403]